MSRRLAPLSLVPAAAARGGLGAPHFSYEAAHSHNSHDFCEVCEDYCHGARGQVTAAAGVAKRLHTCESCLNLALAFFPHVTHDAAQLFVPPPSSHQHDFQFPFRGVTFPPSQRLPPPAAAQHPHNTRPQHPRMAPGNVNKQNRRSQTHDPKSPSFSLTRLTFPPSPAAPSPSRHARPPREHVCSRPSRPFLPYSRHACQLSSPPATPTCLSLGPASSLTPWLKETLPRRADAGCGEAEGPGEGKET